PSGIRDIAHAGDGGDQRAVRIGRAALLHVAERKGRLEAEIVQQRLERRVALEACAAEAAVERVIVEAVGRARILVRRGRRPVAGDARGTLPRDAFAPRGEERGQVGRGGLGAFDAQVLKNGVAIHYVVSLPRWVDISDNSKT